MKNLPRIFQLINTDNDYAGLYVCAEPVENMSDDEVVSEIENAYNKADELESDDVVETAEEILEQYKIYRIYAESVTTDVI